MKIRSVSILLIVILSLTVALGACGRSPAAEPTTAETEAAAPAQDADDEAQEEAAPTEGESSSGATQISMWSHSAGNPEEFAVVEQMVADFNAMQDQYAVVIEAFPQASYNDSVAAASVAGSLPCIVDLDAPTVPNFAWSGYLQPLPISEEELDEMGVLDNDVGRWNGDVYSLGQFDVALLNYARKSVLEEYDIRIPTMDEPWTLDEFNEILDTFKESDEFEYAYDVNAAWEGEWWSYAYSPMLQSFGGDLINRDNYLEAEGVLNGDEAVAWGEWFQNLFAEGYAPPSPADDQGFLQGRIPLWYSGSWSAAAVTEAYGDDALFLPPVDFGNGPAIGAGSWQLGVSATCENPDGATEFIRFTMEPEQIALMSESTSLIPTTEAGAALTEEYAEGGPFRIFYDMTEVYAIIRPETPGYLNLSSTFEQTARNIRDGGNVLDALDDAVDAIERDIEDNSGYGF